MKLGSGQDDERLEKIETCSDGGATSLKNLVRNKAGKERASGGNKWNRKSNELKLGGLIIDMVDLLHESREPLVDSLAHGAGAGISTCHNPNNRICDDDFEYVEDFCLNLSPGFFLRIYGRKVRFLRRVFDDQRHADADDERDTGWNPK